MTEQTNNTSEMKQQAEASAIRQYLAQGDLVKLRGVQEADLERLAAIMSQAPMLGTKPKPWTTQSLKQKFEDKKDPGLWGEKDRTYCAVDNDGKVIGLIQATRREYVTEFNFHVDDNRPDLDELGRDLVATYKLLLTDWHDPARIESSILEVEESKAAWLMEAGFEREVVIKESFMFEGRPVAGEIWGWVNPRVTGG